MIMKPEPLVKAIETVSQLGQGSLRRIYLSPKGNVWNQEHAERLLQYDRLIFLCGRYQGVDQRVIDGWIDEEISVGPYILSGGELPAMILIDSMIRLIPGVLGNEDSLKGETLSQVDPEYPQYTRPRSFRGLEVPEPLLNGNHQVIATWRQEAAKKIKKNS
jgi:tRNA (guanine37-N1)-methyltransferase